MNNMLLAFIFGPIEIVVPVFLTILGLVLLLLAFAFIMENKEEKDILKNGMVVYPETLFEDIEEMKEVGIIRLYSKRIKKNLFVITSSEITEEYKDGKFISYTSAKPVVLKAKTILLRDFLNNIPEVNYKSMIKRIGFQTRIDCKPIKVSELKKQEVTRKKLRIYCDWGECLWGESGKFSLPHKWKADADFMNLYKQMCSVYESMFVWNDSKPYYFGFKNEQHKEEVKNLFDTFTESVNRVNQDEYEIINCLDINNM